MDKSHFNAIKNKWGYYSSWSIWSWPEDIEKKPTSGMSDLSIFEDEKNIEKLNPNIILVALNFSTGSPELALGTPLSNFHGKNGLVYRLRFALRNTPLWGGYMTDVIKDHIDPSSSEVKIYLKDNPDFLRKNIDQFIEEVNDVVIGPKSALIALGNDVHKILISNFDILKKYLKHEFSIFKITHYASQSERRKEDYAKRILEQLENYKIK